MIFCDLCENPAGTADHNLTAGGGAVCNSCISYGLHPDLSYPDVVTICRNTGVGIKVAKTTTPERYDAMRRAIIEITEFMRDEITDWPAANAYAVDLIDRFRAEGITVVLEH